MKLLVDRMLILCTSRQAGAMLANGLIHSGVRTEMDAALALLSEHVDSKSVSLRVASIIGYAVPPRYDESR